MIYAFVPPPKSAALEDNCATLNCFSLSLFLLTYIFSVVPLAIFPSIALPFKSTIMWESSLLKATFLISIVS